MIRKQSAINWGVLILRAERHAGSRRKFATAIGSSDTALTALVSGRTAQPLFDTGARILGYCSEHVDHVPGARELAERMKK